MKWFKVFAVAAVLLGVAASASGDSNTYNYQGSGPYFNPKSGQRVDDYGNAMTSAAFPTMDANLTFTDLIVRDASTTFLALGAADSCPPVDTHRMRMGMLLIDASPAATAFDTTSIIRLAVQIRTHLNGQSDSSSVFAIYPYGKSDMGATVASSQTDSASVGHILKALPLTGVIATPSTVGPWSGEFVVNVAGVRSGIYSNVAINGHTYYYPNGIAIPLSSILGREIYSPWTSIRVRVLSSSGSTSNTRIRVHLVGTPL